MKKLIILGILVLTLLLLFTGCQPGPSSTARVNIFPSLLELFVQKTTLEEAAKVMGITMPVPAYLPKGYEIQEVYVLGRNVRLLISDEPFEKKLVTHTDAAGTRQRYELQSKMEMSISWSSEFMIPVRLPEEKVDIKGRPGYLLETESYRRLLWNWFPDQDNLGVFELGLEAGKGISKEELVKIAESVGFNRTPELYTPQSDQVISERLYDIKKGEFRYLGIYEDGSLIFIQMEGLLGPVDQHVRILKTGKLSEEELNGLIEFFENSSFKDMSPNNKFSGSPGSDMHYSISARLGSSYRYIKASNYLSPDGGKTYPDMPYPLNEIYKRLKDIADNKTGEVTHESL